MTQDEIENRFKDHSPTEKQKEMFKKIREKAKEFALLINELCPEGSEKQAAFTYLDSVVFNSNASMARYTKKPCCPECGNTIFSTLGKSRFTCGCVLLEDSEKSYGI